MKILQSLKMKRRSERGRKSEIELRSRQLIEFRKDQFGIMEEEVRKDIADLSDKDLQKLLRKENPELLVMLPDLQKRLESLKVDVKPLVDSARKEPGELPNGHPISEVGTKIVDCKLNFT